MACSLSHTIDEIHALVYKLMDEDKARQNAILKLAVQFDNACTAKDDLRKVYEKCNDIPQESRALIDTFLKEESDKDYEMNLSIAMVLVVERNRGEHLIRRFAERGNEPDPRDVKIASLKQWIQELELPQLQQDSPAEEAETESNESCPVYDTDNEEEEESIPVYDTDIEDVIEEEEGFVGKGGFDGGEDNIEDVVVVANDLCSSMIQTVLSVDFEEDINTKSHEMMSFGKSIIIKVVLMSTESQVEEKPLSSALEIHRILGCFKTHTLRSKCRHGKGSDFVSPLIVMMVLLVAYCQIHPPKCRLGFSRVLKEALDKVICTLDDISCWVSLLVLPLCLLKTFRPRSNLECKSAIKRQRQEESIVNAIRS
nr:reverse transcriptase domain-containing protein [Tanacetum cinerariifolium]